MLSVKVVLVTCIALLGACGSESGDDTLTVAVAFYPIEEIVRSVGGNDVEIVTLVPRGDEAHEFDPAAKQVARLEEADVVFYLGSDFQPSLERVIDSLPGSVQRVDLLAGLALLEGDDGVDPHVWLDPRNMQAMARQIADVIGADATSYVGDLGILHDEFTSAFAECDAPYLITTHEAFAYLADAYGLTHLAIAGVSPGDEPSARSLEDVVEFARAHDVATIFYETSLPSDLADTVANEIGARTAPLATVESPTQDELDSGESYLTVMRDNLDSLRAGMGCA